MRFLLHPTNVSTSALIGSQVQKTGARVAVAKDANAKGTNMMHAWGQQCSPNCGCVVRLEASMDSESKSFLSATYDAKSVVVTRSKESKDGLAPAYTMRTNKVMFTECSCETIHKLSSAIVDYLPGKKLNSFRGMMEFDGVRSSSSFRHAVLATQGLPRKDTHCFDLLEEALTAMVKGHMPKPRFQAVAEVSPQVASSPVGNARNGKSDGGIDFAKLLATRAMKTVSINANAHDELSPFKETSSELFPLRFEVRNVGPQQRYDWVSYVDELYRGEDKEDAESA